MDSSRPPLRWMVFEAGALGLRMARFERELSSNMQMNVWDPVVETPVWWIFEYLPQKRLTGTYRQVKFPLNQPFLM